MPCLYDDSTLSSSFFYVATELDKIVLPDSWSLQVGVEGDSISIIDIASPLKTEHISTAGIGGASTFIVPIHHIRIGDGDLSGSRKSDNTDNSIVFSSS